MNLRKTIRLIGDQAIHGLSLLEYETGEERQWVGVVEDIEISIFGDTEDPQQERINTAQKVIPFLEKIDILGRIDANNYFSRGTEPLDEWTLLTVYFGFTGIEPFDEFTLHFCRGIWDWSTPYYVHYRLNSTHPALSTLIRFSGGLGYHN